MAIAKPLSWRPSVKERDAIDKHLQDKRIGWSELVRPLVLRELDGRSSNSLESENLERAGVQDFILDYENFDYLPLIRDSRELLIRCENMLLFFSSTRYLDAIRSRISDVNRFTGILLPGDADDDCEPIKTSAENKYAASIIRRELKTLAARQKTSFQLRASLRREQLRNDRFALIADEIAISALSHRPGNRTAIIYRQTALEHCPFDELRFELGIRFNTGLTNKHPRARILVGTDLLSDRHRSRKRSSS